MKIFLVGGAVRDELLNYPTEDKDWVVVGSTPEQMIKQGYHPVGKDFPVFLHPQTKEEYALARTERKTAQGYYGFTIHADPSVTLEEDLMRRDLTINAMAKDHYGKIIDPYHGQHDIKNKLLRHVSPAFSEDPVRILRIARFLARYHHLGFTIAAETRTLMAQMVQAGEVNTLVPERVWQELSKALHEKSPSAFFSTLEQCGALKILFPEIDALINQVKDTAWEPQCNLWSHFLNCLDQQEKPQIRFASALKTSYYSKQSNLKSLIQRLRIPKSFSSVMLTTAQLHLIYYSLPKQNAEQILNLLNQLSAFKNTQKLNNFADSCNLNLNQLSDHKEKLQHYVKVVESINPDEFIQQGLQGAQIGTAIQEKRLALIKGSRKK
ncbi:Multifunctional CCA protein [Piscirickettsia salmonis]|uniref:CCA-adding enzyme n=1 Tax=Piscirickettsia salmonis TaxID=1238 RepID=A0A1L6TE14_PISSA|nr:hypothetical protein [Piscirickettsia salmonis]AKP74647.1 tRNA nucleotidyltransferase [Piscirickettsia salmonis LF-89 = ATCC VR-1361]ALB23655.1 tRNA nucleotidyl transferase [Piscirickettsia salmonis]ALY03518.1 multifunctional CCA tRNA nucleotidyl transferase/2'3'-cyclic phosphodiesterase/2'nucleotidase/phosphatase [Piscirickettsia salmonis]AMA43082.1 multifunctional CCA tRNA nucleotidyl transferase/2'3'-cyclic phosphodiesterase/2'nucleotidase/phosphatase [Piscirickettsia salmonis]AOS35552.1